MDMHGVRGEREGEGWACIPHMQVDVRGQLHGVGSLLPPSQGLWGLNSGCQTCTESASPAEPSNQPSLPLLFVGVRTGSSEHICGEGADVPQVPSTLFDAGLFTQPGTCK